MLKLRSTPFNSCAKNVINEGGDDTIGNKLCEKISHNGVTIEKIQGDELFKLVFTLGNVNYSTQIINIVKSIVKECDV